VKSLSSRRPRLAITGLAMVLVTMGVEAFEVSGKFSFSGLLAGAFQCQEISDAPGFSNTCESAVTVQPEFSYQPTPDDEVFFKLGFSAGNGINGKSPLAIPPWAADLEDDVQNINGRNRDYLLTAWYKHSFQKTGQQQLSASFGIIDATDYLDENAYGNDVYSQFMNPTLTNGPNVFLPSYDLGIALEWDLEPWSLRAVLMEIGQNDNGNEFHFYGLQVGHLVKNRLGAGNYRLVIAGAGEDFLNPAGTQLEKRAGALLSFDQEFGAVLGGWIRFGWQTDDAAVDYNAIYSGGVDIKGTAWGREDDNIGVGYAFVNGGNQDIDKSQVAEAYYRWQLGEVFGLTADIQYQQDDNKVASGPDGLMFGIRATAEF